MKRRWKTVAPATHSLWAWAPRPLKGFGAGTNATRYGSELLRIRPLLSRGPHSDGERDGDHVN